MGQNEKLAYLEAIRKRYKKGQGQAKAKIKNPR